MTMQEEHGQFVALTALAQHTNVDGAEIDLRPPFYQLWGWKKLPDGMGEGKACLLSINGLEPFVSALVELAIMGSEGK